MYYSGMKMGLKIYNLCFYSELNILFQLSYKIYMFCVTQDFLSFAGLCL
jgi:hypothetical protein